MDLLFKRYASPFSLIDGYIMTARFCEFINEVIKLKTEDERWEFYLHKVWDKSYPDYVESIETMQKQKAMSKNEMETTIQNSKNILQNFNPTQGEGEN